MWSSPTAPVIMCEHNFSALLVLRVVCGIVCFCVEVSKLQMLNERGKRGIHYTHERELARGGGRRSESSTVARRERERSKRWISPSLSCITSSLSLSLSALHTLHTTHYYLILHSTVQRRRYDPPVSDCRGHQLRMHASLPRPRLWC